MPRSINPGSEPDAPIGVEESATEFVGVSEEYRRYVQEGLDDVAAGRVRPWEEVEAELRAEFGDFDD